MRYPMASHLVPTDDLREHVTDGSPCPCMPRVVEGVIVHNSYDTRDLPVALAGALAIINDLLEQDKSLSLSEDGREIYENAKIVSILHPMPE